MTSQMLTRQQNARRKRLMQYFLDTPYYLVKGDVADLDPMEAQVRWMLVKENFRGVCFRAGVGARRSRDGWTGLMRKLVLLRDKASAREEGS